MNGVGVELSSFVTICRVSLDSAMLCMSDRFGDWLGLATCNTARSLAQVSSCHCPYTVGSKRGVLCVLGIYRLKISKTKLKT